MTAKQVLFIQEYQVDLNATQAAIRAGYSVKTAAAIGFENLQKPEIARAIEQAQEKRAEDLGITVDFILSLHKETALRCLQKVPVMEFDPKRKEMVQKVEEGHPVWAFDSAGVNRAAELMGKHRGMYKDVTEHKVGALDELRRLLHGDRNQP